MYTKRNMYQYLAVKLVLLGRIFDAPVRGRLTGAGCVACKLSGIGGGHDSTMFGKPMVPKCGGGGGTNCSSLPLARGLVIYELKAIKQ